MVTRIAVCIKLKCKKARNFCTKTGPCFLDGKLYIFIENTSKNENRQHLPDICPSDAVPWNDTAGGGDGKRAPFPGPAEGFCAGGQAAFWVLTLRLLYRKFITAMPMMSA